MSESLCLCAAFISALLGMSWLALVMPVHWKQVLNTDKRPPERKLRILGVLALIMSAISCALADHPSMAILVWILLLAVTAFIVSMLLVWYPSWFRFIWPVAVISSND